MAVTGYYPDSAKLFNERAGFTFIEIITVIFIIGIITTVAISRIPSIDAYNKRVEADTLKTHLRYAQNRAMNTDKQWGVEFLSSSQYRLYSIETAGTQYRFFPSLESVGTVTMLVLEVQPGTNVKFNDLGSPVPGVISVKMQDGSELYSVTAETGFIR